MRTRPTLLVLASRAIWLLLATATLTTGCALFRRPPTPAPHYLVGEPYHKDGFWYYPRENFQLSETGLASVAPNQRPRLTANGEAHDASALAAGHQTLQLPAIARVTNLENGLAVVLRINDRGPSRPNRLLELTPRAAQLLRIPPEGGKQIRIDVLNTESHAAIEGLSGTPTLGIAVAPREEVRQDSHPPAKPTIAPSPGISQSGPPARLPEELIQTSLGPGILFINLGSFSRAEFAQRQSTRLAQFGPSVETKRHGRQTTYRLRIGPLASVDAADKMLDRLIHAGATDARIVVE